MQLGETSKGTEDLRGVTPVVGAVILVGMVLASAALVVTIGGGMVGSLQSEVSTEQASASMDAVASNLDGAGETVVHAPEGGSARVDPEAGWMRIVVRNDTYSETVIEEDLGTLYYDVDDTTFAYQGGGIWRADGRQRSTVHRPPPIQYAGTSDPTLVVPLTTIADGAGPADGKQFRTVERQHVFPSGGAHTFNPVANKTVEISIQSEFYRAWGEYLTDTLGKDDVDYDHDAQTVGANLTGPTIDRPNAPDPNVGLNGFAYNEGSQLQISNEVTIDSYDSNDGPYDPADAGVAGHVKSREGDFDVANEGHIKGDVDVVGPARFSGDVVVEGDTAIGPKGSTTTASGHYANGMEFQGEFSTNNSLQVSNDVVFEDDVIVAGDLESFDGEVHGDLYVHGDASGHDGVIHGDLVVGGSESMSGSVTVHGSVIENAADAELRDPVEPDFDVTEPNVSVSDEIDDIRTNNDNAGATDVNGGSNALKNCPSGCELTAGQYYLQNMSLGDGARNDDLTIDTSDGPVRIAVDENVEVDDGSIDVEYDPENPHAVTFYVRDEWKASDDATVSVADDRTPLLEVFVTPSGHWEIDTGATFQGVVYGLSDGTQRTTVSLKGNANTKFYGALLGDLQEVDRSLGYHRDAALSYGRIGDYDPDDIGDTTPNLVLNDSDVAYLHVERRTVVTDG